jgi:hypothetical protein
MVGHPQAGFVGPEKGHQSSKQGAISGRASTLLEQWNHHRTTREPRMMAVERTSRPVCLNEETTCCWPCFSFNFECEESTKVAMLRFMQDVRLGQTSSHKKVLSRRSAYHGQFTSRLLKKVLFFRRVAGYTKDSALGRITTSLVKSQPANMLR